MRIVLALALFLPGVAATAQEISDDDVGSTLETLVSQAAERVAPCVVSIKVEREKEKEETKKPASGGPLSPMFDGGVFKHRPENAPVSGTIIDPGGWIVTTHFNLNGKLKSIRVTLADGRTFDAALKGFNAKYDAALLKIAAEKLPTLRKAGLKSLKTGQMVLAFGRAPDGRGLTVNPGIVSAPWRLEGRGIQVDAHLNYGNVGGPVVDRDGQLVGITCKIDTRFAGSYGQNSGVGFALTWDRLDEILPDLKTGKNVAESRRPFLGVQANTESEAVGVEVGGVQPGTAAEKAGLKAGDILVEFDGKPVKNFAELRLEILKKSTGDKVKIKFLRDGEERTVEAELGSALGE